MATIGMNITDDQQEIIIAGLQMRMCFIETGDCLMRAVDIQEQLKDGAEFDRGVEVKALSIDQMKLIIDSQDLINKLR
jgi:hypothetical protein